VAEKVVLWTYVVVETLGVNSFNVSHVVILGLLRAHVYL